MCFYLPTPNAKWYSKSRILKHVEGEFPDSAFSFPNPEATSDPSK